MNLQDKLTALVKDNLHVDPTTMPEGATYEEMDLDSLALLEFAVVLEKEFGVAVADDEITTGLTVPATAELLVGKGVTA